ncbi:hypothetical protein GN244_ATG15680 [Phytophthora infestans]|uniref:Uncharacterized protein n=1 Tax=Phytophthora infestans TaxID=4787 RepID=A0A833SUV2_PHYIN|nr:hypothetical protein GN244_ATG15680 [Phytophthora infestans]
MKRLETVHADDRARLLRDHRAYFAGERSADADFASARPAVLRPPSYKPPPMGKDVAYLRRNKELKLQRKKKTVDEPWEPDDEKDEGEDKGSAWEDDDEFEVLSSIKYSAQTKTTNKTKTTGKTSGKTKVVAKAKVVEKKKSTNKTPRKRSNKTLAKEAREAAATSKRNTAAKKRQDPANDDQQAGKKAKDAALEQPNSTKKRRTSPHTACQSENVSSVECSDSESATQQLLHESVPESEPPTATASNSTEPQTPNVRETLPIPFDALDSDCDADDDETMFDEVLEETDRDETGSASSDDESVVVADDAGEEDVEPQSE